MKTLLIGNTGQLGWELQHSLQSVGEVVGIDYPEIDLTDNISLNRWVQSEKPDVIVNAAAYTAVDQAEAEKELAFQINAAGPGTLAEEAAALGSIFIHYSTDFIFDGKKGSPYQETDQPKPINVYGQSKLSGEHEIEKAGGIYFIFRTSWLYSTRTDSFVTKVLDWSRKKQQIKIVTDQIGSPTWSKSLAEITTQALILISSADNSWKDNKKGIYHLAGTGAVSRYEWAKQILRLDPDRNQQILTSLQPGLSIDFPTPATRPEYSALDCDLFQEVFGINIPDWFTSLQSALKKT
jgi:dTDP-4-dehydrorhamnose reductase